MTSILENGSAAVRVRLGEQASVPFDGAQNRWRVCLKGLEVDLID